MSIFNDWFATGTQMDMATRMGTQEICQMQQQWVFRPRSYEVHLGTIYEVGGPDLKRKTSYSST